MAEEKKVGGVSPVYTIILVTLASVAWYRTGLRNVAPNWVRVFLSIVLGYAATLVISFIMGFLGVR